MADSFIAIDEPSVTDKKLDTEQLTVGVNTVERERVQIAGAAATAIAAVDAANGLDVDVTRVSGNVTVVNGGTFATQVDGAALTALQKIDNLAHAGSDVALSEHVPISGQLDNTATTTVTEDQVAPVRITTARALHVAQQGTVTVDGSGVTQPVSHAALTELAAAIDIEVQCDIVGALPAGTNNIGDVDVLSVVPGTGATNLGKAEDGAHASGDVGVMALGVRNDNGSATRRGSADDDYVPLAVDDYGAVPVVGHPNSWSYHENSSSALTDTSVQAAPGVGLSLYVTDIIVSIGAATALNIFFEEGVTTVLGPWYLEAVNGRGLVVSFKTPKKITANTALTVTTSAAIAHAIDVTGFIAP